MKRLLLLIAVVVALVLVSQANAAVDSTDILIKVLVDKGIITEDDAAAVRAEIANIRQDEEATRKSYPVSAKRPIKLSGYVQERYTRSSQAGASDSLEARRVRLALAGDATDSLDYKLQVDFAGSRKAVTGVDLTDSRTTTASFGKPLLLDAIIGYKLPQDNRVSIGQFNIPFSIENLTSSTNLDLINRSQIVEALVPGRDTGNQGRDIGVQFSGVKSLGEDGARQLEYYAGIFNGAGINVADDNKKKDGALRLVYSPGVAGVKLGGSYYNGATGAAKAAHDRIGGEAVYKHGKWTLRSEYIRGKDAAVRKSGYYGTLVRQINPAIQGVIRTDRLDPNTDTANNDVKTFTVGVNYFLNKDGYSRWQLNYERKKDDSARSRINTILAQFQAGF